MNTINAQRIEKLHDRLRNSGNKLAVAESCTGGLIGSAVTCVSGSSDVFEGGIIAYSNRIKREELGVSRTSLHKHGAVSEPVARQMVEGLCRRFEVEVGVSVSGIAGPTGGTEKKPVGLVYSGVAVADQVGILRNVFAGDRANVRQQTVRTVIDELIDRLPTTDN